VAGACGMRGSDENTRRKFGQNTWTEDTTSEELGVDGMILEWVLNRQSGGVYTGVIWFGIETSGGFLWTR